MAEKERLDSLLVQRGLATSRELAKAYIMEGSVYVGGEKESKAGTKVNVDSLVEVKARKEKYCSRGGYKLEKAMEIFPIELTDLCCMDVGASTGGFTDCMLQNGAKQVYAIDVGYGQLAWKLRKDPRVICLERTNFRYLDRSEITEPISFASMDVSFISILKLLPMAQSILQPNGKMVCLVKPQFEAGRENVGKKGVVKDPAVHLLVLQKVISFALTSGWQVRGLNFSPIKGPEGNIEYLLFLDKERTGLKEEEAFLMAKNIVADSHQDLA